MHWSRRLAALFNIQPGEERLVLLMFAFNFFRGIAYITSETAAYALFLHTYGVEGLPFTYISIAIGLTVITLVYLQLEKRLTFASNMIGTMSMLVIGTMSFRFGLSSPVTMGVVLFLTPVWDYTLSNVSNIVLWGTANNYFNIRQGRRIFGLISAGRWLAVGVGGIFIPFIVATIGTENLLFVTITGLTISLIILIVIIRTTPTEESSETPHTATPTTEATTRKNVARSGLWRNVFVLLIFATMALWNTNYIFVDNIYYNRVSAQFPSADEIASFVGLLASLIGFTSLGMNLFVTSRFLSRFGIGASLLILPVLAVFVYAAFVLTGLFGGTASLLLALAVAGRVIENVLTNSILSPTFRLLFQPLPAHQRGRALATSEGIVEPVSIGVAGLLILVLTEVLHFNVVELAISVLVLCTLWIVFGTTLSRRYPKVLSQALAKRRLGEGAFQVVDSSSVSVLRAGLHDPHPEAVIYSLNLMEQLQADLLLTHLPELLHNPSSKVRREALLRILKLELMPLLPDVEALLATEQAPEVKAAALRTVAVLGESEAVERVTEAIHDEDETVRQGAMVGLIQSGRLDGMLLAGQKLTTLLTSSQAKERIQAARVLGDIGVHNFYQPLIPLLHDSDIQVQRTALIAAGKIQHKRLWPIVIEALSNVQLQAAARLALIAGSGAALPDIKMAFDAPEHNVMLLSQLVRISARIKGEAVVQFLQSKMDIAEPEIRTQIYAALNTCSYRASDHAIIQNYVQREARDAVGFLTVIDDLGTEPTVRLLADALRQQFARTRERILWLLSFIYEAQAISRVREALEHGNASQRAFALEVIDTTLTQEMKVYLLPIFDETSPLERRLQRLHTTFPIARYEVDACILAVLSEGSPWLRSCAMYAAVQRHLMQAKSPIAALINSTQPLLNETAHWALGQLQPTAVKQGRHTVLSTIEKVIILKSVEIFRETPDDVLVEVATILEEVQLDAGDKLFDKGDLGNSMYVVVNGKVRIHDGEHTLNYREMREVFGEMALLDPEPRVAAVTAVEDTLLLRLDQEPFYELMSDRIEVVRGIMRVITGNLRARVHDVTTLRVHVQELEQQINSMKQREQ